MCNWTDFASNGMPYIPYGRYARAFVRAPVPRKTRNVRFDIRIHRNILYLNTVLFFFHAGVAFQTIVIRIILESDRFYDVFFSMIHKSLLLSKKLPTYPNNINIIYLLRIYRRRIFKVEIYRMVQII